MKVEIDYEEDFKPIVYGSLKAKIVVLDKPLIEAILNEIMDEKIDYNVVDIDAKN